MAGVFAEFEREILKERTKKELNMPEKNGEVQAGFKRTVNGKEERVTSVKT